MKSLQVVHRYLRALPRHLWAWPGHLRAFVVSTGLTHAFENHGQTADPWPELWSGLAAWDHWVEVLSWGMAVEWGVCERGDLEGIIKGWFVAKRWGFGR